MSIFTVTSSVALLTAAAVQDLLSSFNFLAFLRNSLFFCFPSNVIARLKFHFKNSTSVEGCQNSDGHLRYVLRCLGVTSAKQVFHPGVLAHLS